MGVDDSYSKRVSSVRVSVLLDALTILDASFDLAYKIKSEDEVFVRVLPWLLTAMLAHCGFVTSMLSEFVRSI